MCDTAETVAQPAEVALIRQKAKCESAQPRQVALLSPAIFIYSRCRSQHARHRRNGSATCRGCADPAKAKCESAQPRQVALLSPAIFIYSRRQIGRAHV